MSKQLTIRSNKKIHRSLRCFSDAIVVVLYLTRLYDVLMFDTGQARNSFAYVSMQIQLLEILTLLLSISMLGTVILFEWKVDIEDKQYEWLDDIVKRLKPDDYGPQEWFWVSFYIVIGHISSHGQVH